LHSTFHNTCRFKAALQKMHASSSLLTIQSDVIGYAFQKLTYKNDS